MAQTRNHLFSTIDFFHVFVARRRRRHRHRRHRRRRHLRRRCRQFRLFAEFKL